MIAVKVVSDKGGNSMIVYNGKNVLKPYNKKDLLEALCLYSKWHCPLGNEQMKAYLLKVRSALFKARCEFGTQFLLDLFLMTEEYMKHWPIYAMHITRAHITYVLNQCPDYRIRWEE